MWVRSKYASELAVLAAWVSVLVPWNVVYHTRAPFESTVFFLRFPFFELQFRRPFVEQGDAVIDVGGVQDATYPGTELLGNVFLTTPPTSVTFYDGTLQQASLFWTAAALAFLLAFVLSLALYFRTDETVRRLPVSEVRLMGGLLGVGALGTAVASVLYYLESDVAGTPIPAGVVVIGALALVLLRTKEIGGEKEAGA